MAQFVYDTFTEASADTNLESHTGETGATWTKYTGTGSAVVVASTDQLTSTTNERIYYASGTPATSDYSVASNVYRNGTGAVQIQPLGRQSTGAQTYYLSGVGDSGGGPVVVLFKCIAGSYTQLGTNVSVTFNSGDTTEIKLSMVGSSIKVDWGGVNKISQTDTAITAAGKAGFRFPSSNAAGEPTDFTADDWLYTRTLNDKVAVADAVLASLAGAATKTLSVVDGIAAGESVRRLASALRLIAEGVAAGDAALRAASVYRLLPDSLAVADAAARLVTAVRLAQDGAAAADATLRAAAALRLAADAVAVSDAVLRSVIGAGALTVAVLDAVGLSDAPARRVTSLRQLQDACALADAALRLGLSLRLAADGAAVSDSALARVVIPGALVVAVLDAVCFNDTAVRIHEAVRVISDAVTVADLAGAAFLSAFPWSPLVRAFPGVSNETPVRSVDSVRRPPRRA